MKNPDVNIEYNRFLDPIFIGWISAQEKFKEWKAPPIQTVRNQVLAYRAIWKIYEDRILRGLTEATSLGFKRNHLDIHVVSGNPRPFSFPIVITSRYSEDEFLLAVAHELIHCLFKDNRISEDGRDPYPKNPHILVHALLAYIFIDVLGRSEQLAEHIKHMSAPENHEYKEAWDFVMLNDYREIMQVFSTTKKPD